MAEKKKGKNGRTGANSSLETEEASAIGWTEGLGLDVMADEISEPGDWLPPLQDPNDKEKERGR